MNHPTGKHPTRKQGPIVIKLGGAAVESPENQRELWEAIVALHDAEPGGVVLVHGGGGQVDRLLAALGLPVEKVDGLRVTPEDQIEHVTGVLAGTVNSAIVGALRRVGGNAVGMTIGSGGTTVSSVREVSGVSLGRVGSVDAGDPLLLRILLAERFLPVLSSIGLDASGVTLNVNADEAAASVAETISARAIVLLTDVAGVLDGNGAPISEITPDALEELIASGIVHSGMVVKVRSALASAERSGCPVVIASWKQPSQLVRLSNGERLGTRIVPGSGIAARASGVGAQRSVS